jgi:hypothetical protein
MVMKIGSMNNIQMAARTIVLLVSVLCLGACTTNGLVLTDKSSENLVKQALSRCQIQPVQSENDYTPPLVYQAMINCINQNDYHSSTILFATAGVYSWFDSQRVQTEEAKSLHSSLLASSLASLDNRNRGAFWETVKKTLGNRDSLNTICSNIKELGLPGYTPYYMLTPGANVKPNIDYNSAWEEALSGYLHCTAKSDESTK